jgi:hypothetical protein
LESKELPVTTNGRDRRKRYWYKVSVDAVRAWTTVAAVLAIAGGGLWGYKLLSRHLLEREIEVAIEESEALLSSLAGERELDAYREKVETATRHLEGARRFYDQGELREARQEAERGRTLLTSVVNALRHRTPAGEAQFISTLGDVEIRRGERGEWEPARSRMALQAGDYVKTASNGSAEIMMVDGTLFTVRPGTVLLVSRRRTAFGLATERTLSLEAGWVNLSTARSTSRITTPDAEATVEERSEAVVAYNEQEKVGTFSAYRGSVEVASADGTTRRLGELQQVVAEAGGLSAATALPQAPVIVKPDDDEQFTLDRSDSVVLSWKPVKGASTYVLQVSQNRLFVDNIIDVAERTKTTATIGLRGEGSFVWRVAAVDPTRQRGPWSPVYRFRVAASQERTAVDSAVGQRRGG